MVSTRGIRYKFSEGERVLCYEPDPTKAKVLYDSKVLEVIENKDKRGRRTVEYLIHFQGWNSSWDRCVSEDFVLKDTEENRQLQRDLAEKSQLQLGAYLYRRERKKGGIASAGPSKRARHGYSDDGSSSSTQPDEVEACETADTESSSGSGSGSHPHSPAASSTHPGRAHITLPPPLRDRLTFDYHLVVKRGRVSRLPASPCAAEILESFVKWYARAGAWHPARARHDPPQKPDLLDVSCRLNLVREVADGLRVYFDFILRGHLLYKQELDQYHRTCGQYINHQGEDIRSKLAKVESQTFDGKSPPPRVLDEKLKSPKASDCPRLLDPVEVEKKESPKNIAHSKPVDQKPVSALEDVEKSEPTYKLSPPAVSLSKPQSDALNDETQLNARTKEVRPIVRPANVARRLRSHKSAVSEAEEPTPSTSTGEPRTLETLSSSVGSSGSSVSESWGRPSQAATTATPHTRTPLSILLDKVAKWEIIPREGTEHLPCRVYGAIHLARLFVKLPDFLNATQMPDFKLKLILKHIDMFVQYLDEHGEWFGEGHYITDKSRSH